MPPRSIRPRRSPMQKHTMTLADAVEYGRRWAAIRGSYSPNRSGLAKAIARGRLKAIAVKSLGQSLPIWMVSESDLLDYLVSRRHDLRPGKPPRERGNHELVEIAIADTVTS